MKSLAALLTASLLSVHAFAADAPAAPKVDLAKGAASYAAVCVACHAADGNSTVPLQPILAQQHPEYTFKQLLEFKSGARKDPVMQGFAATLSEADARNIAWWLASQKAKPGFAKEKDLVITGERIFRGGLPDRHIPAFSLFPLPSLSGLPPPSPPPSLPVSVLLVALIHISEPTRPRLISYAVFCLKKKILYFRLPFHHCLFSK